VTRGGADIVRRTSKTDNYSTPMDAVHQLLARERFEGTILEPACGEGNIVKAIESTLDNEVFAYDFRSFDEIYSDADGDCINFLEQGASTFHQDGAFENVITNPPFSLALPFAERALEVARKKVALLLRIQFLEGQKRKAFLQGSPLETVYVFSKRISMYPEGQENKGGGTQCFAWFVWNKNRHPGDYPRIRWI
jgi:predicted RNA methylase